MPVSVRLLRQSRDPLLHPEAADHPPDAESVGSTRFTALAVSFVTRCDGHSRHCHRDLNLTCAKSSQFSQPRRDQLGGLAPRGSEQSCLEARASDQAESRHKLVRLDYERSARQSRCSIRTLDVASHPISRQSIARPQYIQSSGLLQVACLSVLPHMSFVSLSPLCYRSSADSSLML